MCIIIYKPEDKRLEKDTIVDSFYNNSDGAGFIAWNSKDNTLVMKKGFFSAYSFIEEFEPYKDWRSLLHFRIATHGLKNKENCHPFMVNENLGFVHNGIIKIDIRDSRFSDTWYFNYYLQSVLRKDPEIWDRERFESILKEHKDALSWSKVAFIDNYGSVVIHNQERGIWDGGCWFSNGTYKSYTTSWPQYKDDEDSMGSLLDKIINKFNRTLFGMGEVGSVLDDDLDDDDSNEKEDICPMCNSMYNNEEEYFSLSLSDFICGDCGQELIGNGQEDDIVYGGLLESIKEEGGYYCAEDDIENELRDDSEDDSETEIATDNDKEYGEIYCSVCELKKQDGARYFLIDEKFLCENCFDKISISNVQ